MQRDDPPSRSETAIRAAVRLVPSVGESLGIAVDDALARRKAWAQETAERVAVEVDDDALLLERLEDERVQMLFAEALEAAMRSRVDAKRRLLARVVARTVLDDAQVDEAELVTTALRQLDAPHVRALERLRRIERDALTEADHRLSEMSDRNREEVDDVALSETALKIVVEASREEPAPITWALISTGVAEPATVWDGGLAIDSVSTFGHRLLDELHELAEGQQLS